MTLQETLRRIALNRDADAWESLLAQAGPDILRTARRILGGEALTEDACQETLLQIRANAAAFKAPPISDTGASAHIFARVWIMRIAANVSLRMLRGKIRAERRDARAGERAEKAETATPEVRALQQENAELLRRAVADLPEALRESIVLRFFSDLNYAELAAALTCSPDAAKMRVQRGLAWLRQRLAVLGVVLSLGELTAHLTGHAAAHAAGAGTALTAAQKAAWTALLKSSAAPAFSSAVPVAAVTLATKIFVSAAALIMAALVLFVAYPHFAQKAAPVAGAKSGNPIEKSAKPSVLVTPRSAYAWSAFDEMRRAGIRVVPLGEKPYMLAVPVELRFKPIEARKLIETVAAANALKVAWVRGDMTAVLYPGASDEDVRNMESALSAADVTVRRDAAWKGGWIWDSRAVPLLIKAAKDADFEVARQAVRGLRRMGWEAVAALDAAAAELIVADFETAADNGSWHEANIRADATRALDAVPAATAYKLLDIAVRDKSQNVGSAVADVLGHMRGEKVLELVEKGIDDEDDYVRGKFIAVLGTIGGDKALALLEKKLNDKDERMRSYAVSALENMDDERAEKLLEKSRGDTTGTVRARAASAPRNANETELLAWFDTACSDPDVSIRIGAIEALGTTGGEKSLARLETALGDKDPDARAAAAQSLGNVGGLQAVALLERALADPDTNVRATAATALGSAGEDEKALTLLAKALADPKIEVRRNAVGALTGLHSDVAPLLEKALADRDSAMRQFAARGIHRIGGERAVSLLEKSLVNSDINVREIAGQEIVERVGGDRAFAILKKGLGDADQNVNDSAARALAQLDGEQALTLLTASFLDDRHDKSNVVGRALRWDPLESTCRHASLSIL